MRNRIRRIVGLLFVLGFVAFSVLFDPSTELSRVSGVQAVPVAEAAGCTRFFRGARYGGAGTAHNYVEFDVNLSANRWWIEREWWAFYPADLWANPSGGKARAGIRGTDNNPPYSASGYKLCYGN